ncbi:hypothetical protein [Methanobrevibacter arboriphilus]|uniref:hypothetical protein n=1 Tax=Methanobrevibacter arboriphilus TaxID=39441 RepID=UPI0006D01730|nr:hypothetical protein [Methanobrevibacter arboriphilus]
MNKIIIGKISFILLIFLISVSCVYSMDDYNGQETIELDNKSSDNDSLNNYADLNNSSIPIFILPPDLLIDEVNSFNESSNVILEFTIKKFTQQFLLFVVVVVLIYHLMFFFHLRKPMHHFLIKLLILLLVMR